jgi:response regulator RpfG family c-di-GMP phosphodiesterase
MTVVRTRLLCVDDEQLVLSALTRLFRADCDVVTASSGEEALRLVRDNDFHVVVSDQRMPGMKGVDLLRQIKDIAPQTMRILLTGYSDLGAIVDSVNDGEVFRYITKPWKNDALRYTVSLAARASIDSALDVQRVQQQAPVFAGPATGPSSSPSPSLYPGPAANPPAIPAAVDAAEGGAVVVDLLPAPGGSAAPQPVPSATQPAVQPAPAPLPSVGAATVDVLLIDSDPQCLQQLRQACDDGRNVFRANSLEGALHALETHASIGVIVSEVHIGNDDITQLLTTLKRHHPSIVTIVASGYSDANLIIKLINQGQIFRFVGKPCGTERLRETVQRAGKLHLSLRQFSSLAARHSVEDEGAGVPSAFASGFGDSGFASRATSTQPIGLAPLLPLTPSTPPGLLARIANLFRKAPP